MAKRYLYLLDEETGKEVQRWPVDGLNVPQVYALERQILANCGDGVVLRDSLFDQAAAGGSG